MIAAANLIAAIHIAYFLFIVGGMLAIVSRRPPNLVRNVWFRIAHIAAIAIVLFEEATGLPCPLSVLQWRARSVATGSELATSGVGGVLDFLLYQMIPGVALDAMYWSFGALVFVMLWVVPPRRRRYPAGNVGV